MVVIDFFKTHYKDRSLRIVQDRRVESGNISDYYEWEDLHHIYCIARAFYSGAVLNTNTLNTFFLFPCRDEPQFGNFDFADLWVHKAVMIRLNDIGIIHLLNDSCGIFTIYKEKLFEIKAPLSALQLREIFAKIVYLNTLLIKRPKYYSNFNPDEGIYEISAEIPDTVEIDEFKKSKYGELLYYLTNEILTIFQGKDIETVKKHVLEGNWTFLHDEQGLFIDKTFIEPY